MQFIFVVQSLLICVLLTVFEVTGTDDDISYPNLPLGDINVVVLTDTHSWVGGHGAKEENDANYGDVLSFYRLLQKQMADLETMDPEIERDLFFVMNGDWIDGTGLAMNGDPSHLIPLLERMPWDVVNIGNHELYKQSVMEYITRPGGFVDWFGPGYVTSNVIFQDTQKPIGNQYYLLKGNHYNVLVFGFLYYFVPNDPLVAVKNVEDTVKEAWFREALTKNEYDAIMVLAHCGHNDTTVVDTVLAGIRKFVRPHMPVQFITGHTHIRAYSIPGNYSASFEAGRFLDTVGFVSFPTKDTIERSLQGESVSQYDSNLTLAVNNASDPSDQGAIEDSTSQFQHVFLDAKVQVLADILGLETMSTKEGQALSSFIVRVQQELGLFKIVGCTLDDHILENGLYEDRSLWGLFCDHVVPHVFPWQTVKLERNNGNPKVVLMNQGSWRYSLFARELTFDEIIGVSPYNNSLYEFRGVPGSVLVQVNATLNNSGGFVFLPKLPLYIMCPSPASNRPQPWDVAASQHPFDLVTDEYTVDLVHSTLAQLWPNNTWSPQRWSNNNTLSSQVWPYNNNTLPSSTSAVTGVPNAELVPQITSTSMWLDFFDKTDMCQTDNKGSHRPPPTYNKTKAQNETGGLGSFFGQTFETEAALDQARLDFVWLAIAIVILVLGMYIWHRSKIWRNQVHAREVATLEALEEYSIQNGFSDDHMEHEEHADEEEDDYHPSGYLDKFQQGYLGTYLRPTGDSESDPPDFNDCNHANDRDVLELL